MGVRRGLSLAALVAVAVGAGCTESPSTPARAPSATAPPAPASPAEQPAGPVPTAATSSATAESRPSAVLDSTPRVRFRGAGKFADVFVVDEGTERHLRFGSATAVNQSTISLASPETVAMEYIRVAFLGVLLAQHRRRALMVGLGGGTFTTLLRRHFPTMWIDVVEIDPMVRKVAIEYFGVVPDERYRIVIADGAEFVASASQRYDLALVDAYEGDFIPAALQRIEFFRDLRQRMARGGVAMLNLSVTEEVEQVLASRFRQTFAGVSCVRTRWGGLVLFGRRQAEMPASEEVRARAELEAAALEPSFDLVATAAKLRDRCVP